MGSKVLSRNKKAFHDYHIEETLEAGIVLTGSEVKSIRGGRLNLKDSFARILGNEVFLLNVHISPYAQADGFAEHEPERRRKLLLHKREIQRLIGKTRVKGFTLIPTKVYLKDGKIKVEIALAKGKTSYDKRATIKKKEADREVARAMRQRSKDS
ncbi:MAG: SsrA-binding protein [Thermodesulfobacteriota bacterium]|nr:MAG: SsrA-binding protein [Thermodesulfobacteriota bacterium]